LGRGTAPLEETAAFFVAERAYWQRAVEFGKLK
jgi:hypothetical protein